jgi:hypothetical protein
MLAAIFDFLPPCCCTKSAFCLLYYLLFSLFVPSSNRLLTFSMFTSSVLSWMRGCRRGAGSSVYFARSSRSLSAFHSQPSKPIITGQASPEGTKKFIMNAKLPMYHRFEHSGLFINPVIHGAPSLYDEDNQGYVEALTLRAVLRNKSNCLVVYENQLHKSFAKLPSTGAKTGSTRSAPNVPTPPPYYFNGLGTVLREGNLSRDQIVTMANLGSPSISKDAMLQRFDEALELSRLEAIDLAYFEVSY